MPGRNLDLSSDRSDPSSLPPSSAAFPNFNSSNGQSSPSKANGRNHQQRRQQTFDPLAEDARSVASDQADDSQRSKRPKTRNLLNADVPQVRDASGEALVSLMEQFITEFTEDVELTNTQEQEGEEDERKIYINQIHVMRDHELTTLYVDFRHILLANHELADAIQVHYYRFLPYIKRAVFNCVRTYEPAYAYINSTATSAVGTGGALQKRDFSVALFGLPLVHGIRELRMETVGTLMSISGTVTRTSEVRPELLSGNFRCLACDGVINDVEQQFKYTEPTVCPNGTCNNRTAFQLNVNTSAFTDWQKVRIQENASEIPTGSMPRSLDVILRGSECCDRAKPGDKCVFTGTFIVVPDVSQLGLPGVNNELMRESTRGSAAAAGGAGVTGLKSLGVRDLQYKTAFLACMVTDADVRAGKASLEESPDAASFVASLTDQEHDELAAMVNSDHIYSRLVESIAPTVYGHEVVKKGLLLQLMGGVHKRTNEGMNLRGDINICIVGDPSTSKSQFLKYICSFLPRSVYTSGKASSAAGLTAAVVKDEETGEFTIEAGALMLADNGICCIDEFDKMDISDQVAIHEAMEQQTISIAKAGIHATLNARTSILAAANPVGGRYDKKKSLRANVMMSAPIMSRFDLFFVVLDECNEKVDLSLAKHIVSLHQHKDIAVQPEFSTEALQRYIAYARTFNPKMTPEAAELLVEKYRLLRQDDGGASRNSYRITVRQLESMIRLSEAIARANCKHEISPAMVREAYSLLRQSIIHVELDDIEIDDVIGNEGDQQEREALADGGEQPEPATQEGPMSPTRAGGSGEQLAFTPQPQAQKKKIKITHDKYMEMQSLLVLHLTEVERSTGAGLEREALIDWYLEQKEEDMNSLEELDAEKDLVGKVLKKLVKDNYLIEMKGDVQEALPDSMDEDIAGGRVYYMVHPSVDVGA